MLGSSLTVLAAAASVVLARTPPGFQPGATDELIVDYNNNLEINGQVVQKNREETPLPVEGAWLAERC